MHKPGPLCVCTVVFSRCFSRISVVWIARFFMWCFLVCAMIVFLVYSLRFGYHHLLSVSRNSFFGTLKCFRFQIPHSLTHTFGCCCCCCSFLCWWYVCVAKCWASSHSQFSQRATYIEINKRTSRKFQCDDRWLRYICIYIFQAYRKNEPNTRHTLTEIQ